MSRLRKPGQPARRLGHVDQVLADYAATRGTWAGLAPATADDVRAAVLQLGVTPDGPWSQAVRRRIVSQLELIARQRRPRYRAGYLDQGRLLIVGANGDDPTDQWLEPGGLGVAMVFDPDGADDNLDDALETFRRLAEAELASHRANVAVRAHAAGGTVAEAAHRLGLSERTYQEKRSGLRQMGIDPDTLDRR